jgi:hypothetical protein
MTRILGLRVLALSLAGVCAGAFGARVAYGIPFNRGLDEGITATTLGYGFRS